MKEVEPRFILFPSPGSFYKNILLPREPINAAVIICDFVSYFNQHTHPPNLMGASKMQASGKKSCMTHQDLILPSSCRGGKAQAAPRSFSWEPGQRLAEQHGAWQSRGGFSILSSALAWSSCSLTSVSPPIWALAWTLWTAQRGPCYLFVQTDNGCSNKEENQMQVKVYF